MRKNTLSRIAVVAFLAAALAFLWGSALGWFVSTVLQPNYLAQYEEIVVAPDGTPLVASRSPRDWRKTDFRTLQGKPLDGNLVNKLQPARFFPVPTPPGLWDETLPWDQRIHGFYDSGSPTSRWYYIINEQLRGPGYLYFVVYDSTSKLPIGYVGRLGFQPIVPEPSECFQVGNGSGQKVLSSAPNVLGGYPIEYGNSLNLGSDFPTWFLFVRDGDSVKEIDMRTREIRLFYELPDLMTLSSLVEASAGKNAFVDESQTEAREQSANAPVDLRAYADYKQKVKMALRSPSQIAIVDPKNATSRIFELPERVRDREFWAYSVGNGQLLLHVDGGWVPTERKSELIWIDKAGKELRSEKLELAGYLPVSPRERAWTASVVAPVPLAWLIGGIGYAPVSYVQINLAPDYSSALRRVMDEIWPGLLIVLFTGAVCAVIALRLHRQYDRPDAWAWGATVFLLGPAGSLAYWIHWNRPPRERCASCGALVPRDREACAACKTEFALPRLLGTEVYT